MIKITVNQLLGSLIEVLPCGIICYLLSNGSYHLKKKRLLGHFSIILVLTLSLFTLMSMLFYSYNFPHCYLHLNFVFMVCILMLAFYFYRTSTLPFWKKAFILIFSFNYGLLIGLIKNIVCSQLLSYELTGLKLLYNPMIILVILIAEIVLFPALLYFLSKIQRIINVLPDLKIWRRLTLIDFVFCVFYYIYSIRIGLVSASNMLFLISALVTVFSQILLLYLTCYILSQIVEQQQALYLNSNILRQLKIQDTQYRALNDSIALERRANHDIRHHVRTIQTLLEGHNPDEALTYLKSAANNAYFTIPARYCANPYLNATFNYYLALALEEGIEVKHEIDLLEETPFENTDLCIIVGNCLENALDAARLVPRDLHPFIHIKGKWIEQQYLLSVRNSCVNPVYRHGNVFQSTKHEGNGIGILNIETIALKYHGTVSLQADGRVFQILVILHPCALS